MKKAILYIVILSSLGYSALNAGCVSIGTHTKQMQETLNTL